jgi:hypothetical protein
MKENSDFYELRVLDDDDGTPDTDMQPLDRYTIHPFIHSFIHECNGIMI